MPWHVSPIAIEIIGSLYRFGYDLTLRMYVHPYICTYIHYTDRLGGGEKGILIWQLGFVLAKIKPA